MDRSRAPRPASPPIGDDGREPNLRTWLGDVDIYLVDQLLKGRFTGAMTILDAGCGDGRNLVYLLRAGASVFAVDESRDAIDTVRRRAADLAPALPPDNFRVERVESMSFADEQFDGVICSAVLHFASTQGQFDAMLNEMWRVLKRGGVFFARLASTIGLEDRVLHLEGRRYRLPDGTDRFLVDEPMILAAARRLGGTLLEPLKTVNVQHRRCMTTWCMKKEVLGS